MHYHKTYYAFFAKVLLLNRYAKGAAKKIELKEPEITPIPKVNANSFNAQVQKTHIATITKNVVKEVPIDLLIVCHKLFSKSSATSPFHLSNSSS
jgi:hypothetical protein